MKKITLMAWAATLMDPAPCRNTVLKWRKEGRIVPMPVWEGRAYYVVPTAKLMPIARAQHSKQTNASRSHSGTKPRLADRI